MSIGQRIKKLRVSSGITQKELATAVGLTESAIRNYELEIRKPKPAVLDKIADFLDVPVESLEETAPKTARGALETLFRAERELGLRPVVEGGRIAVEIDKGVPGAQKTAQAIKAWQRMREQFDSGEISVDEYELWKARLRV